MPVILAIGETKVSRIMFKGCPRQIVLVTLLQKKPNNKKGWWNGSNGRFLPSKCEALSANPSIAKKKTTQKQKDKAVPQRWLRMG
jgi:hypothetical protein